MPLLILANKGLLSSSLTSIINTCGRCRLVTFVFTYGEVAEINEEIMLYTLVLELIPGIKRSRFRGYCINTAMRVELGTVEYLVDS